MGRAAHEAEMRSASAISEAAGAVAAGGAEVISSSIAVGIGTAGPSHLNFP